MTDTARVTGRGMRYSPSEDAIILATAYRPAEETNRQLTEAGFEERSPNALKQRRHYLQHRSLQREDAPPTPKLEDEAELTKALLRRRQLNGELVKLDNAKERIKEQLVTLNASIQDLLDRLKEELEQD